MIRFQGVDFIYPQHGSEGLRALDNIDLTITQGEFVAVAGHNGSGKSTLLRLLAALLFPTGGTICVEGTMSSNDTRWAIREQVAVVFQDPDDQLVATQVIDDVAFGTENLGLSRSIISQRVEAALEALQLLPLRHEFIENLSWAEKQRVAIAGALAMRPRLLVLDEPTSSLTYTEARRLMDVLRNVRDTQGTTIVHITHAMWEVALADRVVVLREGRLVFDGPPAVAFQRRNMLLAASLEVPIAVQVADALRAAGVDVPGDVVTGERLALALQMSPVC